jgi:predicted O-methyltransferase YrrM
VNNEERSVEVEVLNNCYKNNVPYFGPLMAAVQGSFVRIDLLKQLVFDLVKERRHVNVLEIGSWAGGSAIAMAKTIKENGSGIVFCVDPWQRYDLNRASNLTPLMISVYDEMSNADGNEVFRLFQHNVCASNVSDLVVSIRAKSSQVLPLLNDQSFDLIFIDGDHRYEAVKQDIEMCKRLVSTGGIICGDDHELTADQVDDHVLMTSGEVDYVLDPKAEQWYHPGVTRAVLETLNKSAVINNGLWMTRCV